MQGQEAAEPRAMSGAVSRVVGFFGRVLESQASANVLIIVCIALTSIPLFGIGYFATRPISPIVLEAHALAESQNSSISAHFNCYGGKSINATFSSGEVNLALSDGRGLAVPQALSASGARYANPDESFIFWNKGDTAVVEEDGIVTYAGCTTSR